MHNDTRRALLAYTSQVAILNGVASATEKFTVAPSVQQTLEKRQTESSAFLQAINMIGVRNQEGEKLGLGAAGTIARRTNTKVKERKARVAHSLGSNRYRCEKTDFDTALPYEQLDAWSQFPEFQTLIRDAVLQQQALDRIMIGFNGTHAAIETDPEEFPLLQDVNKGWLQHIREQVPAQVIAEGEKVADKVIIDPRPDPAHEGEILGDYATLDAAVFDAKKNLAPWAQERADLVVIVGRNLINEKIFPMINKAIDPTEQVALNIIMGAKQIGGLPAAVVPFFPADAFLITTLKNLSIYWQIGARRRAIIDNPKADQVENFESSNDAYVVEDFGLVSLVENIEVRPAH
jgi:P2 family phage major capsid protein